MNLFFSARPGFFAAFLLAILLLFSASPQATEATEVTEHRVIDGDTVEVLLQVWPGVYVRETVRVKGIDAPESRAGKKYLNATSDIKVSIPDCEINLGKQATKAADQFLFKGSTLTNVGNKDRYGRRLADFESGGELLSNSLLKQGLARPYSGQRRTVWLCDEVQI